MNPITGITGGCAYAASGHAAAAERRDELESADEGVAFGPYQATAEL